jgi:formylglycine-generating enzyme required for sulfatase activity
MAVLFISHSSEDDGLATDLATWLNRNGFTDHFVDHSNTLAGEKWRDALRQAAHSCRVVLCVITESWLVSAECYNEFMSAWYMGKRIIPFLAAIDSARLEGEARERLNRVLGEDQGIFASDVVRPDGRLAIENEHPVWGLLAKGLRAAGANAKVGLDPASFAIDRRVREYPFPGLASFGDEDADAALFYGRSREIAHVLEDLRSMRAINDSRPLVIQGASGSGKSSLLKAGIIPRLRRESPAWLPLRAFRPGADPLLNFAEALSRTAMDFGQSEAIGLIRDRLRMAWQVAERRNGQLSDVGLASISKALETEGASIRAAANREGATILICVDQAEEMVRGQGESESAVLDYLAATRSIQQPPWQIVLSIRTDSFPELQKHPRFQLIEARGYDLRSIPVFRFDSVVEEPARRYGAVVDAQLVDALMEDAPKQDALPLLAFALERLWRQYGSTGRLAEAHYQNVGGLRGLIEDAAERALRGLEPGQDVPLSSRVPSARLIDVARSTFVPALIQINEQGAPVRRVARWIAFNDEQRDLMDRFDRWRLVVRRSKEDPDGGTIEVAHEALFREWARLEEWLRPERARLETLRTLQVDASIWVRKRFDAAYLNHREKRLKEARELITNPAFSGQIGDVESNYLEECVAAESVRRGKARRVLASYAVLVVCLGALGAAWWQQRLILEQYRWRWIMIPTIATPDREAILASSPESEFSECKIGCPVLRVISSGLFQMGANEAEYEDESPPRDVRIERPFAVGKYEITFDEWDMCVAAGECAPAADNGWGRGMRPVINVTWHDAKHYTLWLSRLTGKPYRLLTEAEWEYVARGGSYSQAKATIPREKLIETAWFSENSGEQTHPVGTRAANAHGVHDMFGNVWEWCEDTWVSGYKGAPEDGSARLDGPADQRVVRGASWESLRKYLRLTYRSWYAIENRSADIGFRIARSLR